MKGARTMVILMRARAANLRRDADSIIMQVARASWAGEYAGACAATLIRAADDIDKLADSIEGRFGRDESVAALDANKEPGRG